MSPINGPKASIVRNERGLTISGTRTTLYRVYECSMKEWPKHLIREWLGITDEQLTVALEYIDAHRDEVEQEYRVVVRRAAEIREDWEDRNRERLERMTAKPLAPGTQALRDRIHAKLQNRAKA